MNQEYMYKKGVGQGGNWRFVHNSKSIDKNKCNDM